MDSLGVDRERVVNVFNKSDLVAAGEPRNGSAVWVSAVTGEGIPGLKAELVRRIGGGARLGEPRRIPPGSRFGPPVVFLPRSAG